MNRLSKTLTILMLMAFLLSACAVKNVQPPNLINMANPASTNCEKVGGKVEIKTRPDGGEYGVCVFSDNRQCEEWALYRGECPSGGVEITGLVTEAAVFCAISGGEYTATGNIGASDEQGTCKLKNDKVCDAQDYYSGKCSANE